MLAIKLQRKGKKHQPSYRVVVTEKRSKMASPPVEDLGSYSVFTKKARVNADRVKHWLGVGAKPTPTVHNLLVRESIVSGEKIAVKIKKGEAGEVPAPAASVGTAPAGAEAPEAAKTETQG
jgi:small subunit ribosomal protein S16